MHLHAEIVFDIIIFRLSIYFAWKGITLYVLGVFATYLIPEYYLLQLCDDFYLK